jgi:hypothetical protein
MGELSKGKSFACNELFQQLDKISFTKITEQLMLIAYAMQQPFLLTYIMGLSKANFQIELLCPVAPTKQ